jgi:hypothetical protein
MILQVPCQSFLKRYLFTQRTVFLTGSSFFQTDTQRQHVLTFGFEKDQNFFPVLLSRFLNAKSLFELYKTEPKVEKYLCWRGRRISECGSSHDESHDWAGESCRLGVSNEREVGICSPFVDARGCTGVIFKKASVEAGETCTVTRDSGQGEAKNLILCVWVWVSVCVFKHEIQAGYIIGRFLIDRVLINKTLSTQNAYQRLVDWW